jgi:hypothetical protein
VSEVSLIGIKGISSSALSYLQDNIRHEEDGQSRIVSCSRGDIKVRLKTKEDCVADIDAEHDELSAGQLPS